MRWDWRVKVRLTKKSEKKSWKNSRGEGYLVNLDLIDAEGSQIQAILFKDMADKYYDILVEGNVYTIEHGTIKEQSGRYSSIRNDFCLVLDRFSDIKDYFDDESIPKLPAKDEFCFKTVAEIGDLYLNDIADIIGIVYVVGPIGQVQIKSGEVKLRQNILLIDETNLSVCVCFWGEKIVGTCDFSGYPVVAIKNAKVSEFA